MAARKDYKIRHPTADRFERFQRDGESATEALARLLDRANVPEFLHCSVCDEVVQAHARTDSGDVLCLDCAGIDRSQLA